MGARTKSRKRALDILFEADQRGLNAQTLLVERLVRPTTQAPLADYTVTLVEGVVRCWTEINELLATYSQGWTVERMPAVDRAILRLATWEVVYSATRSPTLSPSTRRWSWPRPCPRTSRRCSSTACWLGSRRSSTPSGESHHSPWAAYRLVCRPRPSQAGSVPEQAAEHAAAAALLLLVPAGDDALVGLDEDVALAAEGHLEGLAGAAANE
jgi:hypothetical protein